jgi:hypothetical protein
MMKMEDKGEQELKNPMRKPSVDDDDHHHHPDRLCTS